MDFILKIFNLFSANENELKIKQLRAALNECVTVDKCISQSIELSGFRLAKINQIALAALRDTR
jgi:hypothetical protein